MVVFVETNASAVHAECEEEITHEA
jgi:hypothetical protein